MLYKTPGPAGKTMHRARPLLLTPQQAYSRPEPGKVWFQTTTTVWRVDEIIKRRVRDWRRLLGETGHTGARTQTMRTDHESIYTGTHSVFPAPLVEWVLLRYAPANSRVLDAFAGGPPRAVVAAIMGYEYVGFEIRQEQIDENMATLAELRLSGSKFVLGDGCKLGKDVGLFDVALTCPPYFDLEKYSELPNDLSNASSYRAFDLAMLECAKAHRQHMKPGAFVCIVVGPFRDKKTSELIDFPAHTVDNFQEAGFIYWQQIVLSKNFASAAKRSTNAWSNFKLVPAHEFLLVFRTPGGTKNENKSKRQKPLLAEGSD